MLDIEYMRKIHNYLDVQDFKLHKDEEEYITFETTDGYVDSTSMTWNKMVGKLYLFRVMEAINKKEDFEIHTTRSNIIVFSSVCASREFEIDIYNEDESKESAIIYIMDHIAKNNCK